MASPLSSPEQNQIQSVENELNRHIRQSKSGSLNFNKISELQKQLAQLSGNPNIPDSVRENLQAALNDLKQVQQGNTSNIACLNSAKLQLDHALGSIEGESAGDKPGEVGGGSLGGGSEE